MFSRDLPLLLFFCLDLVLSETQFSICFRKNQLLQFVNIRN